jgi:hypothetical protein
MSKKPKKLTEKHLTFLDVLRESGVTNMYGAVPYLRKRFKKPSEEEAREILLYWMHTFTERHKQAEVKDE